MNLTGRIACDVDGDSVVLIGHEVAGRHLAGSCDGDVDGPGPTARLGLAEDDVSADCSKADQHGGDDVDTRALHCFPPLGCARRRACDQAWLKRTEDGGPRLTSEAPATRESSSA